MAVGDDAPVTFQVEAGAVMQFARALGDISPEYYGALDGITAGVPVPPTFVQAAAHYDPDYPLRPRPGQPWHGSPPGSRPATGGGLHAEQHVEYSKPLLSGTRLTVTRRPGESWSKTSRRGGGLDFSESISEFHDEAGELVVTVRSVAVQVTDAPVAERS